MKINKNAICALIAMVLVTVFLNVTVVLASGELYLPSDDVMADVSNALNVARESNKLVLVVMGANWCHDSRALASRLYQQPLNTLIDEHYETVFVDVGFLDKGKEVISSIGPPGYYATPTVLILDPVSGRLVNADNRHQWGDAYNISMEESIEYFQVMAAADLIALRGDDEVAGELIRLLAEIDSFERLQADRVYDAYAVVGPLLAAYKAGEKPEHFEDYWNEVRDYRMQVPRDLDALRIEARERVSSGESDITLDYPEYPAFSWETEG
jgi:hypothetical protein